MIFANENGQWFFNDDEGNLYGPYKTRDKANEVYFDYLLQGEDLMLDGDYDLE